MSRVVLHHVVDDAGLERLRQPRAGLIAEQTAGPDRFDAEMGPVRSYERTLVVPVQSDGRPDDPETGRYQVTETITFRLAIPFFAPLFTWPVAATLKRAAHDAAAGRVQDGPARQPWWAPPDRMDRRASTVLGLLGVLAIIGGYLGTLITQTITYAAERFNADDSAQGLTLALVRVGVLLALVIMASSDRRGRRLLLIGTALGGILFAATGALSPSLFWLGSSQTVARGLSTALSLLIGIVVAEEMPAGSRAYGVSVIALAAGLGAGMCVWALPLADLGPDSWRILYVIPLAALPLVGRIARLLPETRRFAVHRDEGAVTVDRGRLWLLAASGFLGSMFLAPASQFQNEFLRRERGFSAARISAFTLLTTTPAGLGVAVGGRLADVRGRRLVAAVALVGGAAFTVAAYLVAGWPLWVFSTVGSIVAAGTVPALGVYGPELFPTRGRGRANGVITLVGVAGSALGLLAAGQLSDHLGGLGPAMAILAIGPVLLAGLVVTRYPETAHRELEDINPQDAAVAPSSDRPSTRPPKR